MGHPEGVFALEISLSLLVVGRQAQKLGTDRQSGLPGGVIIDLKTNFIFVVQEEINHAAVPDEIVRFFAYGQGARAPKLVENFWKMVFFRGADEKNLAVCDLRQRIEFLKLQLVAVDFPAADEMGDISVKNIIAQQADDHRRVRGGKGLRGPIHKFGKIVNECRFDLIFCRLGILRPAGKSHDKNQAQKQDNSFFSMFAH
jgi:hypothetical protein